MTKVKILKVNIYEPIGHTVFKPLCDIIDTADIEHYRQSMLPKTGKNVNVLLTYQEVENTPVS